MATQYGAGGGENVSDIVAIYSSDPETNDLSAAIQQVLTQGAPVSSSPPPPLAPGDISNQQDAAVLDLRGGDSYNGTLTSQHDRVIMTGDGSTTLALTGGSNVIKAVGTGATNIFAGDGGQTVMGGAGNLSANLGNGNNEVLLGAGKATVVTGSGDDRFELGSGGATIAGGSGHNQATYEGARSAYTVAVDSGGDLILTDALTGGVIQLHDVPIVSFSDGSAVVNAKNETQELVAKLYQGVLDRDPDANGLFYWWDALDKGATPNQIAEALLSSDEAGANGFSSGMSANDFVAKAYQTMLDRPASTSDVAYWANALNQGLSRAEVLVYIAGSAEAETVTANNFYNSAGENPGTDPLDFSIPSDGSQTVSGGSAFDTATFLANKADIVVSYDGATVNYFNKVTGTVNSIKDVEYSSFADGGVLINAKTVDDGVVARLYDMVFDRDADMNGLKFWWDAFDNGQSLTQIAKSMLDSPEFQVGHGNLSDGAFVDLLYTNLRGTSAGDTAGHDYWTDQLANKALTREQVTVEFAKSAEEASRLADTVHIIH